jgi:hypothetical protein
MPEISEHVNDYFLIHLGFAAHTTFPLCLTFPDAPCVGGFSFSTDVKHLRRFGLC